MMRLSNTVQMIKSNKGQRVFMIDSIPNSFIGDFITPDHISSPRNIQRMISSYLYLQNFKQLYHYIFFKL